jgi:hypothetical protein
MRSPDIMARIVEMPKRADQRILWIGIGEWGDEDRSNRCATRIVEYQPDGVLYVEVATLPKSWFSNRTSVTLGDLEQIHSICWSTCREPEVKNPNPPIPVHVQRRLRESFQRLNARVRKPKS